MSQTTPSRALTLRLLHPCALRPVGTLAEAADVIALLASGRVSYMKPRPS